MSLSFGTLDPAFLVILAAGLVGTAMFVLETLVFDYHPDALVFVGAFGLLLIGVGAAAVDPDLSSSTAGYLYHGVAITASGLAFFVMAYGRRRIMTRTGAEGADVSVLGDLEGGD